MIRRHRMLVAMTVPALVLVAGCQRADDTPSQSAERTVEQAPEQVAEAGRSIDRAISQTGEAVGEAAREAAQATTKGLRSAGEALEEASITAAVKAELMKEPALGALSIDVDTDDGGRVTLSGEVRSTAERQRAEELARATPGVREVDNQLTVRPA